MSKRSSLFSQVPLNSFNSPREYKCDETRFGYAVRMLEFDRETERILFTDECRVQVHARQNYGRALIGQWATLRMRAIRRKKMSVCAAMNCGLLFFYGVQGKQCDTDAFFGYRIYSKMRPTQNKTKALLSAALSYENKTSSRKSATLRSTQMSSMPMVLVNRISFHLRKIVQNVLKKFYGVFFKREALKKLELNGGNAKKTSKECSVIPEMI